MLFTTKVLVGLAFVGLVSATPSCKSGFEWMSNTIQQNPCEVAEDVAAACPSSANIALPALNATGDSYVVGTAPSLCECSTVMYSLISGCSLCQGAGMTSWREYSTNCSGIILDSFFPFPVPDTTRVPQWANQSVEGSDMFNVTLAQIVGDTPELLPAPSASGSAATSNSRTVISRGKLIGGIIGIFFGVVIIGGLVAYFVILPRTRKVKMNRAEVIKLQAKVAEAEA